MAELIANGIYFSHLPDAVIDTAVITGHYYDTGRHGPPPFATDRQYEDKRITYPGIDGVVIVRHGFRGRLIFATLVFVGSVTACNTDAKNTFDTLRTNIRYTVSIPDGITFDGCKLYSVGNGSWENIWDGCFLYYPVVFEELSDSN